MLWWLVWYHVVGSECPHIFVIATVPYLVSNARTEPENVVTTPFLRMYIGCGVRFSHFWPYYADILCTTFITYNRHISTWQCIKRLSTHGGLHPLITLQICSHLHGWACRPSYPELINHHTYICLLWSYSIAMIRSYLVLYRKYICITHGGLHPLILWENIEIVFTITWVGLPTVLPWTH